MHPSRLVAASTAAVTAAANAPPKRLALDAITVLSLRCGLLP